MRILLAEDERKLSDSIVKGLSNAGYAVDAAYDGEEALYEYEVNEYDLIILDLNLPKKGWAGCSSGDSGKGQRDESADSFCPYQSR